MSLIRNNNGITLPAQTNGNFGIVYGKKKSQNWTIVQYQGTGASGNFVETKDVNGVARKPRRVIIKRTDSTGSWIVLDSERGMASGTDKAIVLEDSITEIAGNDYIDVASNGFTLTGVFTPTNASGGQYIALVEFDTNGDGGDGYFNLPADDSVLNVTSGKFTSTNGLNDSGYDVALETVTGSIDFSTANDGINWVAKELGGGYQFYTNRPKVVRDIPTGTLTEYQFCLETGLWYDLAATPLATPISFLPYPWFVASGTPQYEVIDVEPLADVVANNVEFGRVKITDGFDLGQTWQDVTASRSAGVTYTNTTGKPIQIAITTLANGYVYINGSQVQRSDSAAWSQHNLIIPNGVTYSVQSGLTINFWWELR